MGKNPRRPAEVARKNGPRKSVNDLPGLEAAAAAQRKPRLLWANCYCLLDSSSGAAISVRQMLHQLAAQGFDIAILGATVFDHPRGTTRLKDHWEGMHRQRATRPFVGIQDGPLLHELLVTASTSRAAMPCFEEKLWYDRYTRKLDQFRPDLVFYYGGQPVDLLIADEARARQIPAAFYLVNGNYHGRRWGRDVDLILTDSQATAGLYAGRSGASLMALGTFIDPVAVVAPRHERRTVLFVNPTLEKGAGVVVRLALMLESRRPDIVFEVVQSRGDWQTVVKQVSEQMGTPREALANVVVTLNTADMRPIYGRARLLLAPSLWWESAARVLPEAMLNGIPALITERGGMPEMIGDAGFKFQMPPACYEAPYDQDPGPEVLNAIIDQIIRFYDDAENYKVYVERAYQVAQTRHSLRVSTQRLIQAIAPLVRRRAGDRDATAEGVQADRPGRGPTTTL